MGDVALKFAAENRVALPFSAEVRARQLEDRKYTARLRKLILGVESNRLGLRFQGGDIDVMAPSSWNQDQVAEYSQLGWILIVSGIVVVGAIVAHSLWLFAREKEIREKYNELLKTADQKFCADPKSPLCAKWLTKKKAENFEPRKSTIQILESGITEIASSTGSALKWGLIIAIPLIAWSWMGKR